MKPRPPIVEPSDANKQSIVGGELNALIIGATAQLRKKLSWNYSSYRFIHGTNSSNPKGYYLYGVLNEVEKACLSTMQAIQWIEESVPNGIPDNLDDDGQRIRDNILQSRIDELAVWQRKMTELMVELQGFTAANSKLYYQHYLAVHDLQELHWSQADLKEFYGMTSENYAYQEKELLTQIAALAPKLDAKKCWYVKKNKHGELKTVIDSFENRFKYSFKLMKVQLRATLRTQYLSFGIQSRSIHTGTSSRHGELELDDVQAHAGRIQMLALHVVVQIKGLLRLNRIGGSLKTCADIINKNDYPVDLHKRRTDPNIKAGDFVLAQNDLAQVVRVNISKAYRFKSFRVHYLIDEPLPGISEDEFVGEHIRLIYKRKDLVDKVLNEIRHENPKVKSSMRLINQWLREGVVLEWQNGLKEVILGNPGGKEKLEQFRVTMMELQKRSKADRQP